MISALVALAAFCLLALNKKCRDVAGAMAIFTGLSIFLIAPAMHYYAAMATCDLLIVNLLSKFKRTHQNQAILYLSLCSVLTNVYGFVLYYSYMPPDNYNFTMQCIIIMQVMMIWMLRNGGNLGLHILHDVFRANNTNRN